MRGRLASFLDRTARIVCLLVLATSFVAVLGGGTCYIYDDDDDDYCDDDDFDDDCFDDDDFDDDDFSSENEPPGGDGPGPADVSRRLGGLRPVGRAGAEVLAPKEPGPPASLTGAGPLVPEASEHSYELTSYRIEAADEPGAHPVRRVTRIRDLSLFELWGPGEYGAREFALFSARVRAANGTLLALPKGAGRLRLEEVLFTDTLVVVRHAQVAAGAPSGAEPIPGAEQLFVFDLLGALVQIENTTRVPAGSELQETAPRSAPTR